MAQFRPSLTVLTDSSIRDYQNRGYKGSRYEYHEYPTYRELVKSMSVHLENAQELPIFVSRSRRGEWGEWFERWQFNDARKPVIVSSGWM